MMNIPMGFGSGWLLMIFGTVAVIVVIGLAVWLLWSAVNQNNRNRIERPGETGATQSALDIVKQRYARGEITKEQFEEMRRNLEA
jgi:putative membrane protein